MKFTTFEIGFCFKRLYLLCGIIFLMFIILSIKLINLQFVDSNKLSREGDYRSLRVQKIETSRGIISDRMGRLLAINVPVDSLCIDPTVINQSGGIYANISKWIQLSSILNLSLEKLICFVNNHNKERFVYLFRQVDPVISKNIDQLKIPGVFIQHRLKRYYPTGSASAHLIGITNIDNQGLEGIEKSFDSWLSGYPTTRVIRQDRSGRIVEDVDILHQGQSSKNIILSIDERLQNLAYHELHQAIKNNKAESGSIVLIDIYTGEILAMVNSPSYDPNNLSIFDTSVMRNRAITDIFEPGSTIKPIIIMAALKHKVIKKNTVLNTLPYTINGHLIKDVLCYNKLTISEILQKSSNVGVSKLALSMPVSVLINAFLSFDIGKQTNIGLIGENKGKIYSCDRYYSEIEKAALSYGYGLMVTPLQLAKIYAIIGGMGVFRPLSILKIDNSFSTGTTKNHFFSESLIRMVVNMMEIMPLSNNAYVQSETKGYRVAIKTGTIKQIGLNGKYINKYIACTAGIAPVNNPRFALVVVINDPKNGQYYGRLVSSPVFKSVMSYTLKTMNITPDFYHN